MDTVDYYELLGVQRHASATEIKAAYRALAKVMHPDAGGTAGTFRLLREAYETLTDPDRRARYDRVGEPAADPPQHPADPGDRHFRTAAGSRTTGPGTGGRGGLGADPGFAPAAEPLDPATIPWWPAEQTPAADGTARPDWRPALAGASGWLVLLLAGSIIGLDPLLAVLWLLALAGLAAWVAGRARGLLAERRAERDFAAEFEGLRVFGVPGADRGDTAERLTADLLATYLTALPGVRVFHGLAWPGSRFADIDHAVLCGRRLVLIESKLWLPGRYAADADGTLWRNDHVFRGGHTRLAAGLGAFRELLPDLEIRGALIVYPSRSGEIATEESPGAVAPPLTSAEFVHQVGGWLAADPGVLDRSAFRTVLTQVVS